MIVTQHANGTWNVYTDTGQESMADERLVAYGLTFEQAERIAS